MKVLQRHIIYWIKGIILSLIFLVSSNLTYAFLPQIETSFDIETCEYSLGLEGDFDIEIIGCNFSDLCSLFSGGSKSQRTFVKGVLTSAARGVTNAVPGRLARVVPGNISSKTLGGAPGVKDVFVTAADDIAGMNASQIANRLTIPNSSSGFRIIEFNTPRIGLGSPINRTNPGFVGFGRTAGGAREFVIPNQVIPRGSSIRIVR